LSESKALQPWITLKIKEWDAAFEETPYMLLDRHAKVSFRDRNPDIIATQRHMPISPFWISAVGDVKGGDFTAEDKGQLIGFLRDLSLCQPQMRSWAGFITNAMYGDSILCSAAQRRWQEYSC
jgi:hypothetical protein